MFRRIDQHTEEIEILLDGEPVSAPVGITVAGLLLLHDKLPTRLNQATGKPRAPHCLMGACFECLLEIDGVEQRACQVVVTPGMRVTRRLILEPGQESR
jgi:predicted molibdopterin-dependent oxidoreductase YjgC